MGLWDLVPVAKFKSLFLIIIVFWVLVTLIDFQTFNTRSSPPFPKESISLYKDRQLLLHNIAEDASPDSSSPPPHPATNQDGDYEGSYENSTQSLSSTDPTPSISSITATQIHEEIDEDLYDEWLEKQEKFKLHIKRVCNKYGKGVRKVVPMKEFLYDSKHKLLFCRNAKVGTTSWLANFLLLSDDYRDLYDPKTGKIEGSKKLHKVVPQIFRAPVLKPYDRKRLFEAAVSFSIVRHPFERLVSAFQDKLVDQSDKFYTRVVHQIRDTYGEVTFANFVQFILDRSGRVCRTINRCNLDKHWRPFASRCGYCDVPYDVIATAENIAEDQKYIGHMANVTFHKIESHVSSGGSTKDLARKYFSELDLATAKKLYKVYKVDFEMFGYTPDTYFDLAQQSELVDLEKREDLEEINEAFLY